MNIRRGDIIYVKYPEEGMGSEQRGTRPAVVVQNDIGNKHSPTVVVAAITTGKRKCYPMHLHLQGECGLAESSMVLCEQVKTIDKGRILSKIGRLSKETMELISEKLRKELSL